MHPSPAVCAWIHCERLHAPCHGTHLGRDAENNGTLSSLDPERWHSMPAPHCCHCELLAITATSHAKYCPPSQARELLYLASWAEGQESSFQEIQGRLLGPLHDSLYKKLKLQGQTLFYASAHTSNKHETVLTTQEDLHVQKSSYILRVNHNSAEEITKISLYWCTYLTYTEKQILSGIKFYILYPLLLVFSI